MKNEEAFTVTKDHIFGAFLVTEAEAARHAREYLILVESKLGGIGETNQTWLRILEWHLSLHSQLKWRDKAVQEISMRAMAEDTAKHRSDETFSRTPK